MPCSSPVDFLRLYWPEWYVGRQPIRPDLPWRNVLNGTDVFASNFHDGYDGIRTDLQETTAPGTVMVPTEQKEFLPAASPVTVLLMGDFTVHGRYWGEAGQDSCFRKLDLPRQWLAAAAPVPVP